MSLSTSLKRVALVTGSGKKRVEWHVADALAVRGYDIAVHYRTSAKEAAETVEHLRRRLHRDFRRLGYSAAVPQLRPLPHQQGGHPGFDPLPGGRTRHPERPGASQLRPSRACPI